MKILNGLVFLLARAGDICRGDEQFDLFHSTVVGVRLCEGSLDQAIGIIDPPERQ